MIDVNPSTMTDNYIILVDYGYRVFVKLRDQSEVFTLNNCCITGHTISLNVDGTTEETLEFMGYTTPVITAGTSGTDHVADTTVF